MARAEYVQTWRTGNTRVPVERRETIGEARSWTVFKFISAIIGWLAFAVLLVWLGAHFVGGGSVTSVSPPAVRTITKTKTVHVPPPPVHVTVQAPIAPAPPVVKTPPPPEDPLDKLTPEERHQYEIWVLRKP